MILRHPHQWQTTELWTFDQVRFNEVSRLAARRALFFLRLVDPGADGVLLRHVLRQVVRELEGVPLYASDNVTEGPYTGARESYKDLAKRWIDLQDLCNGKRAEAQAAPAAEAQALAAPGVSDARLPDTLRKLEDGVVAYLDASVPCGRAIPFTYVGMQGIGRLVRQHIGYIVALVVAIGVAAGAEAVRSLILNRPAAGLFALLLPAFAPPALLHLVGGIMRRRGRTPVWDVGGRLIRSVRPMPTSPQPWVPYYPDTKHALRPQLGLVFKILAYALVWLAGFGVYSLWATTGGDPFLVTVYLIGVVLSGVVLAGYSIDFVDTHTQAPVRGWLLVSVIFFAAAFVRLDSDLLLIGSIAVWFGLTCLWALGVRHARVLPIAAVLAVLVAGVLGFTDARRRADTWRSVASPQATKAAAAGAPASPIVPPIVPAEWPRGPETEPVVIVAASGGGSRAAVFTARTLDRLDALPEVRANLQAISSVSGGSLAAAAYIAERLRAARALPPGVVPSEGCFPVAESAAVVDFLRPTILGVVAGGGRGRGIENTWRRCPVGLGTLSIGTLRALWRDTSRWKAWRAAAGWRDDEIPFPLPVFNSVTLDRHAVAITPFDPAFFASSFDTEARVDSLNAYRRLAREHLKPTWVFYRSGIYHLDDLVRFDPPLRSAVRASANFPFGFPLVEVQADRVLPYAVDPEDPDRSVQLTDGGALSNSGMWPLQSLLLTLHQRQPRRPVLLLVVDAGLMPVAGRHGRTLDLLGTLFDANPKGERLHRLMLETWQREFGGCMGVVEVTLEPRVDRNVYTTWSLDRRSLARLRDSFDAGWPPAADSLRAEFQRLKACVPSDSATSLPRLPVRVPLS